PRGRACLVLLVRLMSLSRRMRIGHELAAALPCDESAADHLASRRRLLHVLRRAPSRPHDEPDPQGERERERTCHHAKPETLHRTFLLWLRPVSSRYPPGAGECAPPVRQ